MTKSNKFTGVKDAIKERQVEGKPKPLETPEPTQETGGTEQGGESTGKRPRGRPKGGKRNNPQFQQVTLYMPSTVYVAVQHELKLRRRKGDYQGPRDMSELVGALVQAWHKKNLSLEE